MLTKLIDHFGSLKNIRICLKDVVRAKFIIPTVPQMRRGSNTSAPSDTSTDSAPFVALSLAFIGVQCSLSVVSLVGCWSLPRSLSSTCCLKQDSLWPDRRSASFVWLSLENCKGKAFTASLSSVCSVKVSPNVQPESPNVLLRDYIVFLHFLSLLGRVLFHHMDTYPSTACGVNQSLLLYRCGTRWQVLLKYFFSTN